MDEHETSKELLAAWFDEGVEQAADYMIVVTDTFEMADFPCT